MHNPRDPRQNQSGNRLFQNAVRQKQRQAKSSSWTWIALAISVLFASAGATVWYVSNPNHGGAPSAPAAPAAETANTVAPAAVTPELTPTATPTPSPSPSPTARPSSKSKSTAKSESSTSSKRKVKEIAPSTRDKVKTSGSGKIIEPGEVTRESAARSSRQASKAPEKSRPTAAKSTAKASALPKAASARPQSTPEPEPTPRVRFNMRPAMERSANTERVNNLEEFPAAPPEPQAAAPALHPATPKVSAAVVRKTPSIPKAVPQVPPSTPPVPSTPGTGDGAGLVGNIAETRPGQQSAGVAVPRPEPGLVQPNDLEEPPAKTGAPLAIREFDNMADKLSRIDGVDVKVVPH